MPRLTAAQAAAASQSVVGWVEMVRMDFVSGVVAAHSGIGDIEYNGDTYKGVGDLGSISELSESDDFRPRPVNVSLSGVSSTLLANVSVDDYQGRDIDIFTALLDESGAIIGNPLNAWAGFMDVAPITAGAEVGSISMACESRLTRFDRAVIARYTNAEQQKRFSGDKAFEFIDQIEGRILVWGGQPVTVAGVASFSGGGYGPQDIRLR